MTAWTAATAPNGVEVPDKPQYIYGLMCWGQNPAVGGPSCDFERQALANLDWLVCVDMWETETASFWKRPGVDPTTIGTEVFMLPAAGSYEKEGSVSNSGRWAQWRWKALNPPGEAMDDLSIINELGKRLIASYNASPTPDPNINRPVRRLWWGPYCDPAAVANPGLGAHFDAHGGYGGDYDDGHTDARTGLYHASPHKVAWEINGYWCPSVAAKAGHRVDGFWAPGMHPYGVLQENGQTSCGNWLYCSHYVNPGDPINMYDNSTITFTGNRMANRITTEKYRAGGKYIGMYQNWSICWPINRRIIYNGASVYQTGTNVGQPLAPNKWVLDFGVGGTSASDPLTNGSDIPDGYTAPGGGAPRYPFIMLREGHAKLFGPGREDGPFPEHYEPWETIMTTHPLETIAGEYPHVLTSPTLFAHVRPEAYEHPGHGNPEFPVIGTTYRVTEHWQAGMMTRHNPWLCELQPNTFVELSEQLAGILGIANGDRVEMKTQRTNLYGTTYFARACVTKRFQPYDIQVDGMKKRVHIVGTLWHFGYCGHCQDDSANLLTPHIGDANTGIPESKQFICNIRRNNEDVTPGDTGPWLT